MEMKDQFHASSSSASEEEEEAEAEGALSCITNLRHHHQTEAANTTKAHQITKKKQ